MPWWAWATVALAGLVLLLYHARAAFRRGARRDFLALLRERHPGIEVLGESEEAVRLRLDTGEGTLYLDKLYAIVAAAPREGRRDAMLEFMSALLSRRADAAGPLNLEAHGHRLMPRLLPEAALAQMGAATPHTPSGIPGLATLYVLDSEKSVMYLTAEHLKELGLSLPALHERALANLRGTFGRSAVRRTVEEGSVNVVRLGDAFDATRVLLVPGCLGQGEALAAVIPDRDTLLLAPVPGDGDWSGLRKLARSPGMPQVVLDRPLRVTRDGFAPE